MRKNMKMFDVNELFDIRKGKNINKKDRLESGIPYFSTPIKQDGYTETSNASGNTITGGLTGSPIEFSYHEESYWAGSNLCVLIPKFELNKYNQYIFVLALNQLKIKYDYGRKPSLSRLPKEKIFLPCKSNGELDIAYCESVCKEIIKEKLKGKINKIKKELKEL